VMDPSGRFTATTTGLSLDAYLKLNQAARAAGLPLVGHAPVNLGLDALLQARQPLAHTGALSNIYFLLAEQPEVPVDHGGQHHRSAPPGGGLDRRRGPQLATDEARPIAVSLADSRPRRIGAGSRCVSSLVRRPAPTGRPAVRQPRVAVLVLACVLALFWLPILWRSSDFFIERLARRVHEAGVSVKTTLIN
jgi:hypothetical protein